MNCKKFVFHVFLYVLSVNIAFADNQTLDTSTILPQSGLPFSVVIEKVPFQLPTGIHSGVIGVYKGLWIFIAGRNNGLHGFNSDPFPPSEQNTNIYVVNPATGSIAFRSLRDPSSGLNQAQIDSLSVTSPEGHQIQDTMYMIGGYGIDTNSGTFTTKSVLTAINLPGIVKWVMEPGNSSNSVIKNIQQISNPAFTVTGGRLYKLGNEMQLIFGQDFEGVYTPGSNGIYTQQIRKFRINNPFSVDILAPNPTFPHPDYRRRDLNVVPAILNARGGAQFGLLAYAGVFTVSGGVWTVPVTINQDGVPSMADVNDVETFKQGMNQYICATASLYSRKYGSMYNIFFGGASYGFFSGGTFQTDTEIPFINQVTTVQMDSRGHFRQFIMDNQYPTILSTGSNPGNELLFGASATFIPNNIPEYPNGVMNMDVIRKPMVIGYIVGGIMSTLANTNTESDSTASPYIFKVTLVPKSRAK